jgi:mitogen-activated protein kinase organizer 1
MLKAGLTLSHRWHGHEGAVNQVRLSRDERFALSCSSDRTLRLWSTRRSASDAALLATYAGGHGYEVLDVAIALDNSQFVSVGGDRAALLWDVTSARVLRRLAGGHLQRIQCVALSDDGALLCTGSDDTHVRLWDLRAAPSGKSAQVLCEARDAVTGVRLDGHEIMAASADGAIRTYDVRAGELRTDAVGVPIACIGLTCDRQCTLAACLDDTVRLIDKPSGELLQSYRGHANHRFRTGACVSPDDALVIAGSEDGSVYVWDLVESELVARVEAHTAPVTTCVALKSDAAPFALLTASADTDIKFFTYRAPR